MKHEAGEIVDRAARQLLARDPLRIGEIVQAGMDGNLLRDMDEAARRVCEVDADPHRLGLRATYTSAKQ